MKRKWDRMLEWQREAVLAVGIVVVEVVVLLVF